MNKEEPQDKSFLVRSGEPDGSKTAYRYQIKVTYEEIDQNNQENKSGKTQLNKDRNNVKD